MKDDEPSPVEHHLVLHRIDPKQGLRRFYSLMIERDLFGTVRLVRNWGRIGTRVRREPRSSPVKTSLVIIRHEYEIIHIYLSQLLEIAFEVQTSRLMNRRVEL
jgi:hypothetical protein